MDILKPLYLGALLRSGAYYVGRALRGNRLAIERVARRTEQLSRGRRFHARRPFFDLAHVERIGPARNYSPQQIVDEHLHRQTIDFQPVRLHWVDDAWMIAGSVFIAGSQRIEIGNTLTPRPLLQRLAPHPVAPMTSMDEGVLVGTCAGATWFGHWLEDELPLQLLGKDYGTPLAATRKAYAHEAGYLSALGLQPPTALGIGRIGSLVVVDEFAQNPNKARRYAQMRRRLGAAAGRERVYLYRGESGTRRRLINERQLAERLADEGFHVVDVGRASFADIADACRGAAVVAGIEGSHLAHALFMMRDYGTLLILNPPNQVHTTIADIGVFCRLHSGMFVCEMAGANGDFVADIDEVLAFLERLLRHSDTERPALAAYVDEVIAMADAEDVA
jgi:capsular polysaccharide biosynthesis protein